MSRFLTLALFVLLVVGGGSLIGINNIPGAWYQSLAKPPFNPPNWIFGPVWTILYVFIAVAGWRIWRERSPRIRRSRLLACHAKALRSTAWTLFYRP